MKYFSAIITLILLNFSLVITILYFGGATRLIEEENEFLEYQIINYKEKLSINEIEYNLHTSYSYLVDLQKIYLDNEKNNFATDKRISFNNFINNSLMNVYEANSDLLSK